MKKKILLSILLSNFFYILFCFSFKIKTARAVNYAETGNGGTKKFEDALYSNEVNQESYFHSSLIITIESINNILTGPVSTEYRNASNKGGVITKTAHFISTLYQPPASFTTYLSDVFQNLGIVKKTYAQGGVGFNTLSGILPIWKITRNIAYSLYTIFLIYLGLMIIVRAKIDPKTTVSIQNSLPKIIISLILISFSYAIAGILIDLIYLLINLGITIFKPLIPTEPKSPQELYLGSSFSEIIRQITSAGGINIEGIVEQVQGAVDNWIVDIISGALKLANNIGLVKLILSVLILKNIISLFLSLLGSYIQIILSIILSPFQMVTSILPGKQNSPGNWFRTLLGHILTFPAVIIVIMLGSIIINGVDSTFWAPPPLSGNTDIRALIALGIIMIIHKIPEAVKSAFQIKPESYGTGLTESLRTISQFSMAAGKSTVGAIRSGYEQLPFVQESKIRKEALHKQKVQDMMAKIVEDRSKKA